MSKLATLLCIALFATTANAFFFTKEIQSIQKRIDYIVVTAIGQIKEKFESAQQKAIEKLSELEKASEEFSQKVNDDVLAELEKAREKVKNVTHYAKGTDVSKCTALASELDPLFIQSSSEISECVVGKIKVGVKHVESMKKQTDSVCGKLAKLREEGLRCSSDITSLKSALKAVFCIRLVATKAALIAAKSVPAVSVSFVKISYSLATIQPSLSYCASSKGLATLLSQSSNIIKRAEKCVHQINAQAALDKSSGGSNDKPSKDETSSTSGSGSTSDEGSKSGGGNGSDGQGDHSSIDSSGSTGGDGSSCDEGNNSAKPCEQSHNKNSSTDKNKGTTESSKRGSGKESTTQSDTEAQGSSDQPSKKGSACESGADPAKPSKQSTDKDSSNKKKKHHN